MFDVLNLYSGIGGNRLLWYDCKVTAVEWEESIAQIYKVKFPNDTVIMKNAHTYLLKHYKEFDFIWSSPECRSHSKIRLCNSKTGSCKPIYPDMNLIQEIIFLKEYSKNCGWVVENVEPFYEYLIKPSQKIGRHIFWSNFRITPMLLNYKDDPIEWISVKKPRYGISLDGFTTKVRKDKILRSVVNPEIGDHIWKCFLKSRSKLLFNE